MENKKYPKSGFEKDPQALHRYINNIRILTPQEWDQLKDVIPKEHHVTNFKILTITGLRYIEFLRLYDHPEWYNRKENLIHLPEEAQKKGKRTMRERTLTPLPSMFEDTFKAFTQGPRPPQEATWNKNLQRWIQKVGIKPYGVSAKTTRKTIESWMYAAQVPTMDICERQGHDSLTSMRHYRRNTFSAREQREIETKLQEWGIMRQKIGV